MLPVRQLSSNMRADLDPGSFWMRSIPLASRKAALFGSRLFSSPHALLCELLHRFLQGLTLTCQ